MPNVALALKEAAPKVLPAASLRDHYAAAVRAGYDAAAHRFTGEDALPDEHEQAGLESMLATVEHQAAQMEHSIIDAPWTRPKIAELLQDWLATADETGTIDLADLTNALEPLYGVGRALMIARTESAMVYNGAKVAALRAHGWKMVDWLAAPDACQECQDLADSSPMSVEEYEANIEPHPNCVVGSTEVTALGIRAATRREYSGPLVEIVTVGNKRLSVTPNHPVLTSRGWAPAGLLVEGSDVICSSFRDDSVHDPDGNRRPAMIREIFDSPFGSHSVTTEEVKVSAPDFHGDGVGSEICVIRTDRLLRRKVQAASFEHLLKALLQQACVKHLRLARQRALSLYGPVIFHAASRGLPIPRPGQNPFTRYSREKDSRRLFDSAPLDFVITKDFANSSARFSVPSSETNFTFTGPVGVEKVVEVRKRPFLGHVFNLQTRDGFFVADGIITHNCSCSCEPASEEGDEEGDDEMEAAEKSWSYALKYDRVCAQGAPATSDGRAHSTSEKEG